jgi:hypothetical protein
MWQKEQRHLRSQPQPPRRGAGGRPSAALRRAVVRRSGPLSSGTTIIFCSVGKCRSAAALRTLAERSRPGQPRRQQQRVARLRKGSLWRRQLAPRLPLPRQGRLLPPRAHTSCLRCSSPRIGVDGRQRQSATPTSTCSGAFASSPKHSTKKPSPRSTGKHATSSAATLLSGTLRCMGVGAVRPAARLHSNDIANGSMIGPSATTAASAFRSKRAPPFLLEREIRGDFSTLKSSPQTRGGVLASTRSWRPSVTGPGATHKSGSWSATCRATGAMVRCRTLAMITTICSRTRQSAARIASMAKVTWERRSLD